MFGFDSDLGTTVRLRVTEFRAHTSWGMKAGSWQVQEGQWVSSRKFSGGGGVGSVPFRHIFPAELHCSCMCFPQHPYHANKKPPKLFSLVLSTARAMVAKNPCSLLL